MKKVNKNSENVSMGLTVPVKAGKLRTRFADESGKVDAKNEADALTLLGALTVSELPEGAERMNLPPLLKCDVVPIGGIVRGELIQLVSNFTGRAEMRNSKCLWLRHNGTDFLFPVTGQIRQAFKPFLLVKDEGGKNETTELQPNVIGDTFYFKRMPDGKAKKFGNKQMFLFDCMRVKAAK